MNILKTKDGFTLIEIIVAINVAFIAIILIISVYIILNKVFISGTTKIEEKNLINFSFNNLNELLRKEKYFTIVAKKDTMEIDFSSTAKVVFTSGKINIKDLIHITEFSGYAIKITYLDKKEYSIDNSIVSSLNNKKTILSGDIEKIEITLVKNKIIYKSVFRMPLISKKRFNNT